MPHVIPRNRPLSEKTLICSHWWTFKNHRRLNPSSKANFSDKRRPIREGESDFFFFSQNGEMFNLFDNHVHWVEQSWEYLFEGISEYEIETAQEYQGKEEKSGLKMRFEFQILEAVKNIIPLKSRKEKWNNILLISERKFFLFTKESRTNRFSKKDISTKKEKNFMERDLFLLGNMFWEIQRF